VLLLAESGSDFLALVLGRASGMGVGSLLAWGSCDSVALVRARGGGR
jgi:hypothetical protein